MAKALMTTVKRLKELTHISGNIDSSKLTQAILTSQEIDLLPILSTDLFNKISDDIIAGSLSGDYLTLVQTYVEPFLCHSALAMWLPWSSFSVSNGGVSKWDPETGRSSVEREDLTYLINKEESLVSTYGERLIAELKANAETKYPEYLVNDDATDIDGEDEMNNAGGLFLG